MENRKDENIFMQQIKKLGFEDYLQYEEGSRGNLGEEIPVAVYRLLEYSLKEELVELIGTSQIAMR